MKNTQLSKEQIEHFYNNVLTPLNITRTEWQYVLESGIIPDIIAGKRRRGYFVRGEVRQALGLDEWPEPTYFDVIVKVNRSLTLRDSLIITGCEIQPENIPDRSFAGPPEENVTVTIFHFGKGRQMEHEEVFEELRAYGYRPVLVEEILALSAQKPHLQSKFPIAGVGCNQGVHLFWMIDSPVTRTGPRKRRVGIFNKYDTVYDFYRVAAVRDLSIVATKYFSSFATTEEKEVLFVDAEHAAMESAYRTVE